MGEHREIVPMLAGHVEYDLELRRLLDHVIRRWSKLVPVTFTTATAIITPRADTAVDHVVPCRVLVDRMLMDPSVCEAVLSRAVLHARITRAEHLALGGIFTHHEHLYGRMLTCPPDDLVELGRDRYRAVGIELVPAG